MGNERSCCLTHLGKDYEADFGFLNPALGHPWAEAAWHLPGARLRRGWTLGRGRLQEITAKEQFPLLVPPGGHVFPGPHWSLWLKGL